MRRLVLLLLPVAVLSVGLVALGTPEPGPRAGVLSLLAVGDTGQPIGGPLAALRPQYRVAAGLEAEDARAAVDGIVLLGDNFYPDGLEDDELKDRLRANVVRPYCRFLAFTSRGRGSLEEDCAIPEASRHPVPIYAVLGNHDYGERESPKLQKEVVPDYIESWRMPDRVEVHELPGGVSLIPYQSMPIVEGRNAGAIAEALRRAKGPFRILAAHHPIADPGQGHVRGYERRVREAIARAGVRVHLHLGGHEHNLQALAGEGSNDAALHVVAGSGSDTRKVSRTDRERLFGEQAYGFARIDRIGGDAGPRLEVTLFGVGPAPGVAPEARARFQVDPEGGVRRLP